MFQVHTGQQLVWSASGSSSSAVFRTPQLRCLRYCG